LGVFALLDHETIMPDFSLERSALRQGYRAVAGFDEAGRGALFGPVVAAGVMFPSRLFNDGIQGWMREIDDSKRLTPAKRKRLCRLILHHAGAVGWGSVSNTDIDRLNIHRASLEAMRRALERMSVMPDFLLVDGFRLDDVHCAQEKVRQGDKKSISIAAASIVAKVLRDEMVVHLDRVFEGYRLSKHKGYGTREHYQALKRLGPSVFHRRTFNLRDRAES
jgi:ribonuclease HII